MPAVILREIWKECAMAKLGTERRPVRFRVQTEQRLQEIASLYDKNGLQTKVSLLRINNGQGKNSPEKR